MVFKSYTKNVIGVIDSGSGGINVINECLKYYCEDFVYLIDNKNCPYGDKPVKDIEDITRANIDYLIKNFDLDFIIIACNTASSIIKTYDIDVKIPILKTTPYIDESCKNKIILFATKNTIKNSQKIIFHKKNYNNLIAINIKKLPKLIDEYLADKSLENKEKLGVVLNKKFKSKNVIKKHFKNAKIMSLGCTHFKHIKSVLNDIFGGGLCFYECESAVAKLSTWFVRKPKTKSSLRVVLTQEDESLKCAIYSAFRA